MLQPITKIKISIVILSILIWLDCITTYYIVSPNYYFKEGNPLIRYLFVKYGITQVLLFIKIPPIIILNGMMLFVKKIKYHTILFWILLSCNFILLFAVVVNMINISTIF